MAFDRHNKLTRRDFLRVTGAGSVALAVAACAAPAQPSAPAAESGGEAAPSEEAVVLRIQADPDRESSVMDLYKETVNPNVEADFISVTGIDHEEVASKMLAMLAAGEPMDIGFAATEATQLYAGKGLALALDDYVMAAEAELKDYFSDVHPSLNEAMNIIHHSIFPTFPNFNSSQTKSGKI